MPFMLPVDAIVLTDGRILCKVNETVNGTACKSTRMTNTSSIAISSKMTNGFTSFWSLFGLGFLIVIFTFLIILIVYLTCKAVTDVLRYIVYPCGGGCTCRNQYKTPHEYVQQRALYEHQHLQQYAHVESLPQPLLDQQQEHTVLNSLLLQYNFNDNDCSHQQQHQGLMRSTSIPRYTDTIDKSVDSLNDIMDQIPLPKPPYHQSQHHPALMKKCSTSSQPPTYDDLVKYGRIEQNL